MIRHQSRGNDNYISLTKEKDREERSRICGGEVSTNRKKELGKIAAYQEWASSWSHQYSHRIKRHRTTADSEVWNAAKIYTDNKTGTNKMNFLVTPCQLHRNLKRSQSSIAIQIRSEHVGFAAYPYRRNVPGVNEQSCQCGYPSGNTKHVVMACPRLAKGRAEVWRKDKNQSFEAMTNNPEDLGRLTQWILD
ncbi:hypothetical protein K3495_g11632 [Podosphaera aphanis]|nr:hypothetical protein K3495_g11632 [Podosphaera aphanis]